MSFFRRHFSKKRRGHGGTLIQINPPEEEEESVVAQENETNPISGSASYEVGEFKNLWKKAYEKIRQEDPRLLDIYEEVLLSYETVIRSENQDAINLPAERGRVEQIQRLAKYQLNALPQKRLRFQINGKEVIVRDQARKVLNVITSVQGVVSAGISSEPYAAIAWAGIMVILPVLGGVLQQDEEAMNGFEYISQLLVRYKIAESDFDARLAATSNTAEANQRLLASVKASTLQLYHQIYLYQIKLVIHYSKPEKAQLWRDVKGALGIGNWSEMLSQLEEINNKISSDMTTIGHSEILKIGVSMGEVHAKVNKLLNDQRASDRGRILAHLSYSSNAFFDSCENSDAPKCLEETQTRPLEIIRNWCAESDGKMILWLHGMAGTGKSTIARTVAWALHNRKWTDGRILDQSTKLAATFFFQKDDSSRNKLTQLVPALARSLAEVVADIRPYVVEAIEGNWDIQSKAIQQQWNDLIYKPLEILSRSIPSPIRLVFVIDSLDECDDQHHVRVVLKMLASLNDLKPVQLRILISSRPERTIFEGFKNLPADVYHPYVLEKVELVRGAKDDITRFLESERARIADKRFLGPNWLCDQDINDLSKRSDGLFVFASTACRFLEGADDDEDRQDRLHAILGDMTEDSLPQRNLDNLYLQILERSVIGKLQKEKERRCSDFRLVVGTIMVSSVPLSSKTLGDLLFGSNDKLKAKIGTILAPLQSMLGHSDNYSPVRLVHLSFRDFLLDHARCDAAPYFWIDEQRSHFTVLERCLEIMQENLREDMCQLKLPGSLSAEVSPSEVEKHIPRHLQYTCRYWISHVTKINENQRGQAGLRDNGAIHDFMQKGFLYWLEALSLMKILPESIPMLEALRDMVEATENPSLHSLIQDATRFVLSHRQTIECAPLQVYASALIFSPMDSLIRKKYKHLIPQWIKQLPQTPNQWSAELFAVADDQRKVTSVTYSPKGNLVASGSTDEPVRVWDAVTGVEKWRLGMLGNNIQVRAFSPDGTALACEGDQGVIYLVNIAKKDSIALCVHKCPFQGLSFSPRANLLASASSDGTIQIWDTQSGKELHVLRAENPLGIGFLSNGRILAIREQTSDKSAIVLWDMESRDKPKKISVIESSRTKRVVYPFPVRCAFSTNATTIVTATGENLEVYDAERQELQMNLSFDYYTAGIAVSADGEIVAVAILDIVYILRPGLGTTISSSQTLDSEIACLALSPDGRLLVLGLKDGTERIWDATSLGDVTPAVDVAFRKIHEIELLPEAQKAVANKSKLWDTKTGQFLSQWQNVLRLIVSPDRRMIALLFKNHVEAWDITLQKLISSVDSTRELAFAPHGEVAALNGDGNRIEFGDMALGKLICSFEDVWKVTFSPDGHLVALHGDKTRILNTMNWQEVATLSTGNPREIDFAFASGNQIVAWSDKNNCHVWDLTINRSLLPESVTAGKAVKIDYFSVKSKDPIVFSPCGNLVAFSSWDEPNEQGQTITTVHLWKLAPKGHQPLRRRLDGYQLLFTVDGTYFVVLDDRTIRVYETATGQDKMSLIPLEGVFLRGRIVLSAGNIIAAVTPMNILYMGNILTGQIVTVRLSHDIFWISFSDNGRCLEFNRGWMTVPTSLDPPPGRKFDEFFVGKNRICQGSHSLLWLPPQYADQPAAVKEGTVALGHPDGSIHFIEFDLDVTPLTHNGAVGTLYSTANIPLRFPVQPIMQTQAPKPHISVSRIQRVECTWIGCTRTFSRVTDMKRHSRASHMSPGVFSCPFPGCQKTYNRKDNLKDHMMRVHKMQE